MQRAAARPRKGYPRLNIIAGVLVSAALVFSAYSGLRSSFPSSSGTSGVETSSRNADQININRHLKLEAGNRNKDIVGEALGDSGATGAANSSGGPCKPCEHAAQQAQPTLALPVSLPKAAVPNPRLFHTVTTTQGFTNHWQARIHYYHFKKQRAACQLQERCDMGGFTRLLHSGEADDLFDEIPTVVVNPLPASMLKDSGYVVLNRPFAFVEWLRIASIPERYILMAEGDHIFLRPIPNMMVGDAPAAFLFTYMVPEQYPNEVRKFLGPISDADLKLVPRIGNSPTFVSVPDMRRLAPQWYNTTQAIFDDADAHKAWNWVLEMYGFALATFQVGLHKEMKYSTDLMAHPPFDETDKDYTGAPFYLLHYTYPLFFGPAGNHTEQAPFIWKFDKRAFNGPPPRHLEEPPAIVKCTLCKTLIQAFNEATDAIPCWDEYVTTRKVTTVCNPAVADVTKASSA